MIKDAKVQQDTPDDHVFIEIACPDRPAISVDITSPHGRRVISIRVNGMGIFGALLDLKELNPKGGGETFRYCPICGGKLILHSSRAHQCEPVDGGL